MHFRSATIDDATAISALIKSFASEYTVSPDGSGAEEFFATVSKEAEISHIADPRYLYVVAMESDEFAGVIAIRDGSHVARLFVASKFQGRHLATQLWQRVLAAVAPVGDKMFTVNSSLRAVPIYQRFGFVQSEPKTQMRGIEFVPMRLLYKHSQNVS